MDGSPYMNFIAFTLRSNVSRSSLLPHIFDAEALIDLRRLDARWPVRWHVPNSWTTCGWMSRNEMLA